MLVVSSIASITFLGEKKKEEALKIHVNKTNIL